MTSKFSIDNIELLQRISSGEAVVGIDFGNLIVRELAAFRLAAMDQKPVAEVLSNRPGNDTSTIDRALPVGTQLYRHAQPAPVVPDGYVMVPKEPTREILDEFDSIIDYGAEDSEDAWRRLLAAAPQSPGSEPATVPGKWIPVSEQKPDCWCRTCRPVVLNDMRFVVCPDCGNKRCPRANDHRNACTGSNEPGQEGSAYPDPPQEPKP